MDIAHELLALTERSKASVKAELERITGLSEGDPGYIKPWVCFSRKPADLKEIRKANNLVDELPFVFTFELQPMSEEDDDHIDLADIYLWDAEKFFSEFNDNESLDALLQCFENGGGELVSRVYKSGLKKLRSRLSQGLYNLEKRK